MSDDKPGTPPSERSLREAAESALHAETPAPASQGASLSAEESGRLLHELRVHQIELEMQNEQLRASQVEIEVVRARLFDLYDLAPVGYCTLSPEGLVAQANLTAANLLGVGRGELLRRGLSRFLVAQDADAFFVHLKQLLRTGEPQAVEVRLAGGGSRPRWARLALKAGADQAGEPEIRIALSDITELKRAEAERSLLEERVREAQGLEAIQTLAGGIAREFNNAVAIIEGNLQTAREDAGADGRVLASLDEIAKASARGRDLVQQVLSFARRLPMRREILSLAALVEESAALLRAATPKNVAFETRCAPGLPAVMADADQIRQVLFNLATNAIEAVGGRPGRIVFALERVNLDAALAQSRPALRSLQAAHPGAYVRLAVIDDGPGMDAATARRSVEPFYTTKTGDRSAGLGLSVAMGIVASHGGAIDLDTRPGLGATFAVYIPALDSPTAATAAVPAASREPVPSGLERPGVGAAHVLFIDDDSALVLMVRHRLERKGLRISAFEDPRAALAALKAEPGAFDVVVTDYNMPHLSGLDVAREAHAIRSDLPVAIATGYIDEALRANAQQAGVRDLLCKANTVEAFCDALVRLATELGRRPAQG